MLVEYDRLLGAAQPKMDDRSLKATAKRQSADAQSYVALLGCTKDTTREQQQQQQGRLRSRTLSKNMPSSVIHRLDIKFYTDVRRRRQRLGLRARVLAALAELRHLIQACDGAGDKDGRVYLYLEFLNRYYVSALHAQSRPLSLRPGASATPDMSRTDGWQGPGPTIVVMTNTLHPLAASGPTPFNPDNALSPQFDRELYSKRAGKKASMHMVDPRAPCWVDYLVDDLAEAEAHALFRLVAQSKVPAQTQSKYRAAIEEALVFAFNRKGYVLDPLESMRMCSFYIRRLKEADGVDEDSLAALRRVLLLWRHAGRWCVAELEAWRQRNELDGDAGLLRELRFKRWNNVASEAMAWRAQSTAGLQETWGLLREWHGAWTRAMQALCPGGGRRAFVTGEDRFAYPYWRPKAPGRLRLHELTLSSHAINRILQRLAEAGLANSAAEVLGLATSEIGIPVTAAMFNIALHGIAFSAVDGQQHRQWHPPSLGELALTNAHAPGLYKAPARADWKALALDRACILLRAMGRWSASPDRFTLHALVVLCCQADNQTLLRSVLQAFARRWGVVPSTRSWAAIHEFGAEGEAQEWIKVARRSAE
ncbi:hypothetical protein GGF46_004420 [Coemansia sp. RSA 552]|nr:hypothetical protein GGF46_004420 [Coemansia sp. RSA 552]